MPIIFMVRYDSNARKLVSVFWKTACLAKSGGGLGLRNLKSLNSVAFLKFAWNVFNRNSTWSAYIRSRFNLNLCSLPVVYKSSIRPGFRSVMSITVENSRWLIGDRSSVDLWHSGWVNDRILPIQVIPLRHLHQKVSDLIFNKCWIIP